MKSFFNHPMHAIVAILWLTASATTQADTGQFSCVATEINKQAGSKILTPSDLGFLLTTELAYVGDPQGAVAALEISCDEFAKPEESETANFAQNLVAGKAMGYFDYVTSPVKGLVLADARAAFVRGDETQLLREYSARLQVSAIKINILPNAFAEPSRNRF